MAELHIWANFGNDVTRVIQALRLQDKTLPAKFRKALRDTAEHSIRKVRAEALDLPAHGTEHTGVRRRLARGVALRMARDGSYARIITQMPADEGGLPRGFDNPTGGWWHPVHGHADRMVNQLPGSPDGWFREPIADDEVIYRNAFMDVLEDAAEMIAAAG